MNKGNWARAFADGFGEEVEVISLEEIRNWSESRVIKIEATRTGARQLYYAKWSRAGQSTEAAAASLAQSCVGFPAPAGTVVVVGGQEWLIQREVVGTPLYKASDDGAYCVAAKALAQFHERGQHEPWHEGFGPLPHLPKVVSGLKDTVFRQIRAHAENGAFTGADLDLLTEAQRVLEEKWPILVARIRLYPDTLVHGDCHSGNLFLASEGLCLIDWASPMIAPGLLDVVGLLDVAERMGDMHGKREDVLDAYWNSLPQATRQKYDSLDVAFRTLRLCRALLELGWFVTTDDDYGERASRELATIVREASYE